MPLRFRIESLDQVCNPGGTIIDEPVGWDAIYMTLKRDKTWRGFFDFFDDSLGSLQFDFKNQPLPGGGQILKELYDTYGIDAEATLVIEFQCADLDTWDELYRGRFVFSKYKFTCGDMCYVEIGLENVSCLMRFANRYDQKVDLDSLATFDAGEGCESYLPQSTVVADFYATSNNIVFQGGILPAINPGDKFCIEGTSLNDGQYTVTAIVENFPLYTIYVEETFITEGFLPQVTLVFNICIPYTATLPAYDGLGKEITLPEKPLRIIDKYKADNKISDSGEITVSNTSPLETIILLNLWNYMNTQIDEIDFISIPADEFYYGLSNVPADGPYPFADYSSSQTESFDVRLKISSLKIKFYDEYITGTNGGSGVRASPNSFSFFIAQGQTWNTATVIYQQLNLIGVYTTTGTQNYSQEFTLANYDNVLTIPPGDKIWIYFASPYFSDSPLGSHKRNYKIEHKQGTIEWIADTFFQPTTAKVYMVNEALSRIAEATTNDCLRVYSQYFGRTDSQPYSVEETGCGGFEAITNGLKIRNALQADGSVPTMPISMKDLFEGLSAIHNLGLGVEADTNPGREGKQLIRVEPLKYFFNTDVIKVFDGVREIKREVDTSIIYSVYKTGYSKWETENTNGLYDLHGSREYRTKTSQVRNELNKLSNLIASDYAIEVTRRQFGKTTTDWKYDNDNFIVCVQNKICGTVDFVEPDRIEFTGFAGLLLLNYFNIGDEIIISGTVSNNGTFEIIDKGLDYLQLDGAVTNEADVFTCFENITTSVYSVEQGNITQDANILFPEYQYNYRITPARNAMRHLHTLGNQVVNCWDEEIRFTNGTGNITAKGKLEVPDVCVLESEQLAENEDIDIWKFDLPESQFPIHRPELVKFEYPLSYQDYKLIAGTDINGIPNYYKLVGYDCNGVVEYGWIEELKYQPFQGMAEFTIRPQKQCNNIGPILDEDLNPILTEDDEFIYPDNQIPLD